MSVARRRDLHVISGPFGRKAVLAFGAIKRGGNRDLLSAISEIDRRFGTATQVFDTSVIAGRAHLLSGAFSALLAHAEGRGFAQSLQLELICHVASDGQIARAIKKVGVRPRVNRFAFLIIGDSGGDVKAAMREILSNLRMERDDSVIELNARKIPKIIKTFSLSSRELECCSIEDLVLERISLMSLP
ncbi:MAG: KEOPS complex subunit Cgi121 [Candidatus Hadarchaeales archaeon]